MWSEEQIKTLKALKAARLSHGQIAKAMSLTKGQVVGKLYRLAGYVRPLKGGKRPEPHPNAVLAAAIVIEAYEQAIEETGLTWPQITAAVRMSQIREAREAREASRAL